MNSIESQHTASEQDDSDFSVMERLLVLLVVILAFAFVGRDDYTQEVERENAQLRASLTACHQINQAKE